MKKWQHPLPKNTITSRFGATKGRKSPHRGTDYASSKTKDLIRAVTAGEVVNIFYSKCLGWVCVQKTDDDGLYVGYSHLNCAKHGTNCNGKGHSDGSTCMKNLKVGDRLKLQQPVGRQGNSGTCSKGDHVHATIHKTPDPRYAKTFDIEKFIDQKIAAYEKIEATKASQKPKQDTPKVVAPEKVKNRSEGLWSLIGAIWAKKPKGKTCECCGQAIK